MKKIMLNYFMKMNLVAKNKDNPKKRGISQEELAFSAGLDRTYVGGIERGERNVAIVNLKKIADALGVSLSHLLKGV